MTRTCSYPACSGGFDAKRSDARYCSDTCRAKASKDRARARRDGAPVGRPTRGNRRAPAADGRVSDEVWERLAAMAERLAAAEVGVTRAEADRAGWKKVRDQLQAALARLGDGGARASPEQFAAAVRAEVGSQIANLGKRLDAVEAGQTALRAESARLPPPASAPTDEALMKLAKGIGKLNTRVSGIERELRAFNKAVVEAVGDDDDE